MAHAPVLPVESSRGPFRLAVAMVLVTMLVILMGAMTTSTGSGMAFRDWPLSDGQWMPARATETLPGFFEHFHRLLAALAGFFSLSLTVWLWPRGGTQLRLSWIGLSLIIVQGVIGGVGVLLGTFEKGTPAFTSVLHGTLAQLTIATFVVLAYWLSPRCASTVPAPHPSAGAARKTVVVALFMIVGQTILGAISRHTGNTPALWTHVFNALVVFLMVVIAAGVAAGKLGHIPGVRQIGRVLLGLLALQVLLGFVALLVRMGKDPKNVEQLLRSTLISIHVLVGALLTVTTSLFAAHLHRGALPTAIDPEVFA